MASDTYSGSTLALVASLPATYDDTGYEALTWVPGACALREVPALARAWDAVTEDLVCDDGASYDVKGGYKWEPLTFTLSLKQGDAAQAVYQTLEGNKASGSFRMVLAGAGGTYYFTAQVGKFALVDGGTKNDIQSRSAELWLQSSPVYVAAA